MTIAERIALQRSANVACVTVTVATACCGFVDADVVTLIVTQSCDHKLDSLNAMSFRPLSPTDRLTDLLISLQRELRYNTFV